MLGYFFGMHEDNTIIEIYNHEISLGYLLGGALGLSLSVILLDFEFSETEEKYHSDYQ